MATVQLIHVGFISGLTPGTTQHWWWNNAPAQRVWSVSVDAKVSLKIPPQVGATARVQVTSVEYRQVYKGGSTLESEVHFWIKNTGTVDADAAIHMTSVAE